MNCTDTHTHIYLPEFDTDRAAMIERAEQEGVTKILLPAIDSACHESMFRTEEQFPACRSMMGLHPCSVKENYKDELRVARQQFDNRKFIGVGEIGLDFYWDLSFTEQQYDALHQQLEWALHFDLPVSIHSRNATDECIKVVSEHQKGKLKGVFHCFSGTVAQANQIKELGLYWGIGGVLTFKKSGLDAVIKEVGLDNVVLETDAPYLAPAPFRGKRNEPSYLKYVIAKLAEISNISIDEVVEITNRNVMKVFGV